MNDESGVNLRAENNPKFYGRFKWLGIAAIGFMVWSLYDAMINYPEQQIRSEAFLKVAEETLSDTELREAVGQPHGRADVYLKLKGYLKKSPELKEAWESKAQAEGWSLAPFKKLRTDGDILSNYIMAVAGGCAGVWFLLTVFRTNGRWFELNDQTITSRWGETFDLDQVTAIDKKLWRDKGIARVRYRNASGRTRTFVVDNYKYHKKTTDTIMRMIEVGAGVDKIINGKPEDDPSLVPAPTS